MDRKPQILRIRLSDGTTRYIAQETYTNGDQQILEDYVGKINSRALGKKAKFFWAYEADALTGDMELVNVDRIVGIKPVGDIS